MENGRIRILQERQKERILALQVMNEINYFCKNIYQNKIGIFVKLISEVCMRWKNWSEFKSQDLNKFREEDWSKIKTPLMNSRPEFRNYRMKLIVWMIREILKIMKSVRSGPSHVPSQPALLPPFRDPGGMLSRKYKPPDIRDTHGISGNVIVNPPASSSSPYPGGFNPWIPNVTEDTSPHVTSERQNSDTALDPRCQSGQWARNSFDPKEGRFSEDYGADLQRLQISDLHFDKFPTPATFACWKIRFKTEVHTCSQVLTEAMLWIKEVEMVESVDDLKSSRSIRGNHGPNFELLEARIASALNRIIQNTRFKKKVNLEEQKAQKEYSFLRGRQIACLIYEYFRVTGANDSVENYADLFTVALRNEDIQEFDSKWDEILQSMTQIPPDDILEGLYKLRIRDSEKLKTVLELYNMEIHQKKAGPDYHRITWKELCTTPFCEKCHPPDCLFYKTKSDCRFGEKCSYGHRQVDEQPTKRSKKNDDKSAVAMLKITRQLGCVFQDMEPPKSTTILRKSSNIRKPIRCVRFTKAVLRHANIRH